MAAGICEPLNLMVVQPTAATVRRPQTDIIDLSFAAPDEETSISTPTIQNLFQVRPVKTKYGPAPGQQDFQIRNHEKITTSPQGFQSMTGLYLVENKALKKDFMKIL